MLPQVALTVWSLFLSSSRLDTPTPRAAEVDSSTGGRANIAADRYGERAPLNDPYSLDMLDTRRVHHQYRNYELYGLYENIVHNNNLYGLNNNIHGADGAGGGGVDVGGPGAAMVVRPYAPVLSNWNRAMLVLALVWAFLIMLLHAFVVALIRVVRARLRATAAAASRSYNSQIPQSTSVLTPVHVLRGQHNAAPHPFGNQPSVFRPQGQHQAHFNSNSRNAVPHAVRARGAGGDRYQSQPRDHERQ